MDTRIEIIAHQVRNHLVSWVKTLDPTDQFVPTEDLEGFCGIASWTLLFSLRELGIQAEILWGKAYGYSHCWVEVAGEVVDLTASQFGPYARVLIAPRSSSYNPTLTGESVLDDLEGWSDCSPYCHEEALESIISLVTTYIKLIWQAN